LIAKGFGRRTRRRDGHHVQENMNIIDDNGPCRVTQAKESDWIAKLRPQWQFMIPLQSNQHYQALIRKVAGNGFCRTFMKASHSSLRTICRTCPNKYACAITHTDTHPEEQDPETMPFST